MNDAPLLTLDLLEELRLRWRQRKVPIERSIRAGLTDKELDACSQQLGVTLSDELRLWWGWHDGVKRITRLGPRGPTIVDQHPGPEFLSTAEAATDLAQIRELLTMDDVYSEDVSNPSWVPVTRNISGGWLVCDLRAQADRRTPVRYMQFGFTNDLPPAIIAGSLGQIVAWWIECYDLGVYVNDSKLGWVTRPDVGFPGPVDWYVGG